MQRIVHIAQRSTRTGRCLLLAALMSTASIGALSQRVTTAVPFLLISPDARSAAIGSAGTTQVDAASAIFSNVAGLGYLAGGEIQLNVVPAYLASPEMSDVRFARANFGVQIPAIEGAIGVGMTYFGIGRMLLPEDNFLSSIIRSVEFAISVGYGAQLNKTSSAGAQLRFIHSAHLPTGTEQAQETAKASTVSGDIGILFKPERIAIPFTDVDIGNAVSFGAAIRNIGPSIHYIDEAQSDPLPTDLRLGIAAYLLNGESNRLTWTLDASKLLVSRTRQPNGVDKADPFFTALARSWYSNADGSRKSFHDVMSEIAWGLGLEYLFADFVALRAGWFYAYPGYDSFSRSFTLGFGLQYEGQRIDASYSFFREEERAFMDPVLRISLLFSWDRAAGKIPDSRGPVEKEI